LVIGQANHVPDDAAVVCTVQKRMCLQPPQEKSRANSVARLFVRTTNLNLTEPLRSFRPGFNLAEGPVVIALRSQLVPIIGATAF
jgi:hypothetical protein